MLKNNENIESNIYRAITNEDFDEFSILVGKLGVNRVVDLSNCSFRAMDLRKYIFTGRKFIFDGCYFRNTDLRGVDLSTASLWGASIHNARISGCFFPDNLGAQEIVASNIHGIRMRVPTPYF